MEVSAFDLRRYQKALRLFAEKENSCMRWPAIIQQIQMGQYVDGLRLLRQRKAAGTPGVPQKPPDPFLR